VDGIHTGVRLGSDDRLWCLVMVGARLDGTKELVALADGYRESEESWAEFLRDLKGRGMRAPVLAIGDGALGLWAIDRDRFAAGMVERLAGVVAVGTGVGDDPHLQGGQRAVAPRL
jgi:transposase-like protein